MTTTREQIIGALYEKLVEAYPWGTTGRRLKLTNGIPVGARPAMFLHEVGETYVRSGYLTKREIDVAAIIFIDAKDPNKVGGSELNTILDAVDAALATAPNGAFAQLPQTLGGLVSQCYVVGKFEKNPGDLEGDGHMPIPIRIILP